MYQSLEKRFRLLRGKVEGLRNKSEYEHTHIPTPEEQLQIVPVNAWHCRILSELDFCLQMQAHGGVAAADAVDNALTVLERAQAADGVLTDDACRQAEMCLLPLEKEARTYTLLLVGHAHLDMNWQWGWDETVATVIPTLQTVLRLMEEYPEFCFSQSQASDYKIIEDYAPEMMESIKERIQEGRWEVTASAWVETDKNMPCTESLMNHILYTKQYLKEHWGIEPESLDLDFSPDTFGHSAYLPELDALGGIRYYYHCRGIGDADMVLYRWKAPSGRELLMYKEPYWYNSSITPAPAIGLPRVAGLCGGLRTGMAVYGVGDHGGGPTRRDLNRALEMQQWPVFPRLRFATMHEYFAAAEHVREKVPLIERELNAIFTGCYTTQSRIKKGNRRAEMSLLNAEKLSALTAFQLGAPYASRAFEGAWQKILFTHFHDILTGSCVQDSREHAMGLYQEALAVANSKSAKALETLAAAIDTSSLTTEDDRFDRSEGAGVGYGLRQGNIPAYESGTGMTRILHIVNTTGTERYENAELTIWDWPGNMDFMEITDIAGNRLPFERASGWQVYWGHRFFRVRVTVKVPAYGYTTVMLREKEDGEITDCFLRSLICERLHAPYEDIVLENKYLTARFDFRTGQLCSLVDKASGMERIREGETGGLRYIKAQKTIRSSWEIDRYLQVNKVTELVKVTPLNGHLNSGLQTEHKVDHSRITTTVTLGSEDRFLRVQFHVDWKEEAKQGEVQPVLSYCLPLAGTTGRMLCDVPGGTVWRPDQELDVPCQRYGAAELSDGRVLALASDCKYGFRLSRGELSVTLINTADNPDPYPERGIQDISLFLLSAPADASLLAKETDICLNPLQYMTNTAHGGTLPITGSLLQTLGESAVFTGVARRDGCLSVRMYEAAGQECPVTVRLPGAIKEAYLTDLLGNRLEVPVMAENQEVHLTLAPYTQAELRMR